MKLKITERKFDAGNQLKEKLAKKMAKFDKFFDDDTEAHVVMSKEKNRLICEITINYHDTFFRVEQTTSDMYASIDECVESLKKQLRKHKTKLENRFKHRNYDNNVWAFEEENHSPTDEEPEFKIIKSKRISVKPMYVEEAILQMNLLNHSFFVFRNAETDEIDIVYSRKDGNYGLIETD